MLVLFVADDLQLAPVDIIAVVDVSGSMSGHKLALLQNTLNFLIDQLKVRTYWYYPHSYSFSFSFLHPCFLFHFLVRESLWDCSILIIRGRLLNPCCRMTTGSPSLPSTRRWSWRCTWLSWRSLARLLPSGSPAPSGLKEEPFYQEASFRDSSCC